MPIGQMPLLPSELVRKWDDSYQIRPQPIRLRWNLDDLITQDGHKLHCAFECTASVINEKADLKMLEEVFLATTSSVTDQSVVTHFAPALRAAAGRAASTLKAQPLIDADPASINSLTDALKTAANKVAFSCGIEIKPPFNVSLESTTFHAQRIEEMQRTLAQRRHAGQVEHFERAANLLKQFEELRKSNPDIAPSDILKQLAPSDQGMMLQTLLLATGRADQTKCLWAVAGNSLLRIDGRATPPKLDVIPIPQSLGPLRSVQPGRIDGADVLLIGARSGVIVFDPASSATRDFADASINSQLGFSKVIVWNNQIWACHGDAGIIAWNILAPQHPAIKIGPAELRAADNPPPLPTLPTPPTSTYSIAVRTAGIRNITALSDEHLVFSVGHYLVLLSPDGTRTQVSLESGAEVVAIIPDGQRVAVVQDDGTLSVRDRTTLVMQSTQRRCGKIAAAAPFPCINTTRLLLASEEGPIYCVSLDDELITQYLSNHRGLRALTASPDLIAGISADRQRVVLWNSWDGKKPLAEVLVAAQTKHRAGDIEFV